MKCAQCNEELTINAANKVTGKGVASKVEFQKLPFLTCSSEHNRKFAYPDFGNDLRIFVFESGEIKFTKYKGLLKRYHYCSKCKYSLREDNGDMLQVFVVMPLQNKLGKLEFTIEARGYICKECHTTQFLGSHSDMNEIANAIVDALKNAKLS